MRIANLHMDSDHGRCAGLKHPGRTYATLRVTNPLRRPDPDAGGTWTDGCSGDYATRAGYVAAHVSDEGGMHGVHYDACFRDCSCADSGRGGRPPCARQALT